MHDMNPYLNIYITPYILSPIPQNRDKFIVYNARQTIAIKLAHENGLSCALKV
jgi:hypothetical protein